MLIHYCEQNSEEWLALRSGKPTASEFFRIVTPTGKLSKASSGYAHRLIAEELLKEPIIDLGNLQWVERGKMLEPDAAELYEFETGDKTKPIGFITNDDGTLGCSPDRLAMKGGIVEIKCPAPQTHIGYMLNGFDMDYKPQVQGQLYITGLEWCDWFSFHPELPAVRMRVKRDEDYIKILADSLTEFCRMKDELKKQIVSKGYLEKPNQVLEAAQ